MSKFTKRNGVRLTALALAGSLGLAGAAHAAAPMITGSITFANPEFSDNYFDSSLSTEFYGVPAGYGNSNGSTTVPITGGVEFGYEDLANLDTADFTENTLTVTDRVKTDAYMFTMTFFSTKVGFFNNIQLTGSQNFVGQAVTNDAGTMLKVTSFGSPTGEIQFASFSFLGTAAPEPATWAMMIMGFGFVGAAMRGKRTRGTFATA